MASIDQLNDIYREALGRDVDPSGIAAYSGMDVRDVWDAVLGSQEYKNRTIQAKVDAGASGYQDWLNKGGSTGQEFHESSAGDYVVVNPGQAMGSEYQRVGERNGMIIYQDLGDGDDGGFLGGFGDIIGSTIGGIAGFALGGPVGATIGAGLGGAIGGGAEEYEISHDWADTGQAALYGGAQGALTGFSAGFTSPLTAAAVAGGGTTLLQKAQGGTWGEAATTGAVSGLMSGIGSAYQGYQAGDIDWVGGFDRYSTSAASVAKDSAGASASAGTSAGAGEVSGMAGRYDQGYDSLRKSLGVTLKSSGGTAVTPSSQSSSAVAQMLSPTIAESAGMFGTGLSAMEFMAAGTTALTAAGLIADYLNQPEELSPEEEGHRKAAYDIAYWSDVNAWRASSGAGYGDAGGTTVREPTTPGSVYKRGSITA